ncbi:MAG: phosphopantothenoylcysteine decarboxylase [Lysobacterales bacterium]|nr:MAG: phosphopantothenoylcysteine decarboxylase [Xanthomonadales bacterium]
MSPPQRILLGVGAGIAAYKSLELARRLRERGAEVRAVLSPRARRLIAPLAFQAVTGQRARFELWDEEGEAGMSHIELARWAEAILLAPATADLIARLAHGLADDLLTTVCLASEAPLWIAPAMNRTMWAHPATQNNVRLLQTRGARLLGPASGAQACGEEGPGRMLEPDEIVAALCAPQALAGLRLLVTAGPTFEDIDPVRFIGNRSSGRMGFAIAAEAARQGARVTLISGPVALQTPIGVRRIDVRSAREMLAAVLAEIDDQDVFVAAAAVADYRPRELAEQKIKKGMAGMNLELEANPDILATVADLPRRPFLVGFAAETENLRANAMAKLAAKKLDLIAANWVGRPGQGFDAEENALLLLWPGGEREIPRMDKAEVARALLATMVERLESRASA